MTAPKPLKRIRAVQDRHGYLRWNHNADLAYFDVERPDLAPYTEHFYTLEEKDKPMEPKKEMTAQDAWIAMAKGECVDTEQAVHRINRLRLEYWRGEKLGWTLTSIIDAGPYSIVPDPSKPKEVEDDKYKKDWQKVEQADTNGKAMKYFLERYFVRKP